MFKKITTLALLWAVCISSGTFAYTQTDVDNANYLANRNVIHNWSLTPANYNLDSRVSRVDIMGMVLAMSGTPLNNTCRGDFADIDMTGAHADWACRTIETAADQGVINAQLSIAAGKRTTRPYATITRAEALAMIMNAYPADRSYPGYADYLNRNFPTYGNETGYTSAHYFWAPWQANVFYDYIRTVARDDTQLSVDPRVNVSAKLREVFDFASHTLQK